MKLYQLFSKDEAKEIVSRLEGWSKGQASSQYASRHVKNNEELQFTDSEDIKALLAGIHSRLVKSPLHREHLVRHVMVPKFNRYREGGEYKSHADAGWMGEKIRTDLACTIFLNDDYEGGELCANGLAIKGPPGSCVVYECWRPHHVAPVTKGERICAITWMQSLIPDHTQLELLQMLQGLMNEIDRTSSEERLYAPISSIYGKLVRMWMN